MSFEHITIITIITGIDITDITVIGIITGTIEHNGEEGPLWHIVRGGPSCFRPITAAAALITRHPNCSPATRRDASR